MTNSLTNTIRRICAWLRIQSDRGATMVEYVLLVALVALVGAVGWGVVGSAISTTSDNVCDSVAGAQPATGTQVDCPTQ